MLVADCGILVRTVSVRTIENDVVRAVEYAVTLTDHLDRDL